MQTAISVEVTVRLWALLQKKVVSAARAKKADITGPDDKAVAAKAEVVEEVKEKVSAGSAPASVFTQSSPTEHASRREWTVCTGGVG